MSELSLKQTGSEDIPDKPAAGLKDLGHIYPTCSNCDAVLMDIWVVKNTIDPRTNKPFEWNIRASCPFCGDKSFPVKVVGMFQYGGYGRIKEDNPEDDIPSTVVDHFEVNGDLYEFEIRKAGPNAKAIKF